MEKHFQVSAPGKVILHGEHSVVHGKKAIACCIGSRIKVSASYCEELEPKLKFSMPALCPDDILVPIADFINISLESENPCSAIQKFCNDRFADISGNFTALAMGCCLYGYFKVFRDRKSKPSVKMLIESELSIGAGLGSSAALNCCLASTYLIICGDIAPHTASVFTPIQDEGYLSQVNSLAFELEKIVHSTPSGIDNSIATYGGAVSFQQGCMKRIKEMPQLQFLTIDTGVPRSSKVLVNRVWDKVKKYPKVVEPILEAMHNIACESEALLHRLYNNKEKVELLDDLGNLMMMNQCLLSSLGVSHESLNEICSICARHGFPAKLTGAGGGGCAIVLASSSDSAKSLEPLLAELSKNHFSYKSVVLGGPGVMYKST